ncbi:MAG: FHA domain-containing protein, partial [Planctomycetaceae bacterium]|nr:FHA domain-containing protein [Planctomycetaceae bacterium]
MQVLLQIIAGPATGKRFRLRQGQVATVGRTEWSDFCVPQDAEMADVHFQLQCDAYRCLLRRMDSAKETQRNGEPVDQSV